MTFFREYIDSFLCWWCGNSSISSSHTGLTSVSQNVEINFDNISKWSAKYIIKLNSDKSFNIPIALRKCVPLSKQTNPNYLDNSNEIFGLILDKRLTRSLHLKTKRKVLNSRLHLLRPISISSASSQPTTNYQYNKDQFQNSSGSTAFKCTKMCLRAWK